MTYLVEDVVVALGELVVDHARLLEQVRAALGAHERAVAVELELRELAKARAVVVAHGLGVTKGLEQRVHLNDLLDRRVVQAAGNGRQVVHEDLRGLGLASARLATHEDRLVALRATHVIVGRHTRRVHVRRELFFRLVQIAQVLLVGVQVREPLVRVHGDANVARVRVRELLQKARLDVEEDRSFMEIVERDHIFNAKFASVLVLVRQRVELVHGEQRLGLLVVHVHNAVLELGRGVLHGRVRTGRECHARVDLAHLAVARVLFADDLGREPHVCLIRHVALGTHDHLQTAHGRSSVCVELLYVWGEDGESANEGERIATTTCFASRFSLLLG